MISGGCAAISSGGDRSISPDSTTGTASAAVGTRAWNARTPGDDLMDRRDQKKRDVSVAISVPRAVNPAMVSGSVNGCSVNHGFGLTTRTRLHRLTWSHPIRPERRAAFKSTGRRRGERGETTMTKAGKLNAGRYKLRTPCGRRAGGADRSGVTLHQAEKPETRLPVHTAGATAGTSAGGKRGQFLGRLINTVIALVSIPGWFTPQRASPVEYTRRSVDLGRHSTAPSRHPPRYSRRY